jgi:hypothetical protein
MNTWSAAGPETNRRRSQRVILSIPVTVSEESGPGPFSEETQTLAVNAHGALVMLTARVSQGQKLILKSNTPPNKQTCRVVYVGPTADGRTQIGVEFTEAAPHFWPVAFPPAD